MNRQDRVIRASSKAFDRIKRVANDGGGDEDLRLYESLQPDDFKEISKQYGADNTLEYIQEMERRLLKGGIDV